LKQKVGKHSLPVARAKMEKTKIRTKNFVAMLFSNFLGTLVFYMLMTSMAVYAVDRFGTDKSLAGLTSGIFVIGALISRVGAGRYMDRFGRKRMILVSNFGSVFATAAYLLANGIGVLLAIRFLHGFICGFLSTTMTAAAIAALPADRRGEGNAYFSLSLAASMAVGPFLANFLTDVFSYRVLFVFCAACCAASSAGMLPVRVVEADPKVVAAEKRRAGALRAADFYEKKAVPISVILFFGALFYSSVLSFLNAYAQASGLGQASSLFFIAYAALLFVSRPVTGKLYDRKGENIVLYPAFVMYAISFVLIAFTSRGYLFAIAAVFMAFGYGTIFAAIQIVAIQISPAERLGLAISTCAVLMDAGIGLGAYVNGALIDLFGYHIMYLIMAAAVIALIPAYFFAHGRKAGGPVGVGP
jgi:MFS family permease